MAFWNRKKKPRETRAAVTTKRGYVSNGYASRSRQQNAEDYLIDSDEDIASNGGD